ncbi:MAG TPA: D-alanyl-D-alanine carboxypeptidase family protein [Kaistiaceae bacterium]|nr:D-alanyl-D-alanine carboxypeptidase family protein [Kaistiaceae bacterium]
MQVPTTGRRGRPVAVLLVLAALVAAILAPERALAGPSLVFDLESGEVKSAENALQPWYPASVTKIMTAYVTFRALRAGRLTLTSPVVISKNAAAQAPSKMGFKPGTVLTVDNALKMMIVKSANDIAVALGETVAGSEAGFVAEMNEVARSIGMTQTVWANPNGLPNDAAHTTARDLGVLTRAALTEYPEYAGLFSISAIRHGKRVLRSHNLLLDRYPGAIGMKTGFICASGFNLVAASKRGGRTLVAVVLGARSGLERAAIAKSLLDDGFSQRSLFGGGSVRTTINTLGADQAAAGPYDMRETVCGKNRVRPSIEDLVEDEATPTMASAYSSNDVLRALQKTKEKAPAAKTKNGKEQKVDGVTVVLGPPLRSPTPVQVFVGGADGVSGTTVDVAATADADVPLPRPRPNR